VWDQLGAIHLKKSLRDLDDPRIRGIAIANLKPRAYGSLAEEALRTLGLWDRLQDKTVFGENISSDSEIGRRGGHVNCPIALRFSLRRAIAQSGMAF